MLSIVLHSAPDEWIGGNIEVKVISAARKATTASLELWHWAEEGLAVNGAFLCLFVGIR